MNSSRNYLKEVLSKEEPEKETLILEAVSLVLKESKQQLLERLSEKTDELLLEFEAVICDCGEPYKNTDPHDKAREVKALIQEEIESITNT